MKKSILFFILSILIATAAFAQEFTFQGLPWGSSGADIIAKEGQPTSGKGSGFLIYENKAVSGYNATIFFYLLGEDERLEIARYLIGSGSYESTKIYTDLTNKLSALYGKPSVSVLENKHYWVVSGTMISISTLIEDNRAVIFIDYYSPKKNKLRDL